MAISLSFQSHTGSISVKPLSRVEAKIVPHESSGGASVLLGVRPEWRLREWSGLDVIGYKIMDQPFSFVRLPSDEESALELAEVVLKQLKEVLEPK